MLVLSRKRNEAVIIDGTIRIVVVSIRGDKVRLGIEAPKDVTVHREEVQNAIEKGQARPEKAKPETSQSKSKVG